MDRLTNDRLLAEAGNRRAYLLSQRGYYANAYGESLLMHGQLEAARGIAERADDPLLRVRVIAGEARFAEVLRVVPAMIAKLAAADENAALAFRLAVIGINAALTLQKPADFIEDVINRFVLSEPHHVVDGVVPFISLVAACGLAPKPVGKKCIDRLTALRDAGKIPTIFSGSTTLLVGAGRFVEGDWAGATKAFRTLLRAPGWLQEPLHNFMAIAFERAGSPDLAEEIDAPVVGLVDAGGPAELAWVRAAKRAEKRGDMARAKKLAQAVIERWRVADEDIPSMKEMQRLAR
jgi:hypothetical protein